MNSNMKMHYVLLIAIALLGYRTRGAEPSQAEMEALAVLSKAQAAWVYRDGVISHDTLVRGAARTNEPITAISIEGPWHDGRTASFEELTKLRNLQALGICSDRIADEAFLPLSKVTWLKRLRFDYPISDSQFALLADLKGLDSLSVSGLSDQSCPQVGSLTNLQHLSLWGTDITDAGVIQLRGLQQLNDLHLSGASIGDQGLKAISTLTNLCVLSLPDSHVTDAGLKHLTVCRNLQKLVLRGSKITDSGVSELLNLTELRHLDVGYTRVTWWGVNRLSALESLTELGVSKEMQREGHNYPVREWFPRLDRLFYRTPDGGGSTTY